MASNDADLDEVPAFVGQLLWDYAPASVVWSTHRDVILGRVLASGNWASIAWTRRRAGDAALREHLARTRGRGLSPRALRFWQVLLGLADRDVDAWVDAARTSTWARRAG
jgi:hypothetical protein